MPNKTIYVAEDDLPLFEEALELGDNLSATIAKALRMYVEAERAKREGFEEITVRVGQPRAPALQAVPRLPVGAVGDNHRGRPADGDIQRVQDARRAIRRASEKVAELGSGIMMACTAFGSRVDFG